MSKRQLQVKAYRKLSRPKAILDPNPLGLNDNKPTHSFGTLRARLKFSFPGRPWAIPNEYVCAEIGRFIKLPISHYSFVCCDDDERTQAFASLLFNYDDKDPYPFRADACIREMPELMAGILAFDVFVCNADRNPSNLQIDDDLNPRVVQVFDHDLALLGNSHSGGVARLDRLTDRLGITDGPVTDGWRHVIIDALTTSEHFAEWAYKIAMIPHQWLIDLCMDAMRCGLSEEEAGAVSSFLVKRKMRIGALLNIHSAEFKGIKKWTMV